MGLRLQVDVNEFLVDCVCGLLMFLQEES